MKVVIQRVATAAVEIDGAVVAQIQKGLLLLVGIEDADNHDDIDWLVSKICNLRIFDDAFGVMNLSLKDIRGELVVVSQFTLQAMTKKGNRPSYIKASKPEIAIPIYKQLLQSFETEIEKPVQSGVFGADMQVRLTNDGPVTIVIDSKNRL